MPRRTPASERLWFCCTSSTPRPSASTQVSLNVSTKNPRSSPWTSGSIRTRSSISVGSLRTPIGSPALGLGGARRDALAVLALVVLAVLAGTDRPPPARVVAVTGHGPPDALGEADSGGPTQPLQADGGERVAVVVPGPVGDVGDQRLVAPGQLQYPVHDLDVWKLVGPPDVVDARRLAALEHDVDRGAAVLDEQPVADLLAVSVDGKRITCQRIQDAERDQLLGVLARPVVVGGPDDQRIGAVGTRECGHHQVASGLRRRVGRRGLER